MEIKERLEQRVNVVLEVKRENQVPLVLRVGKGTEVISDNKVPRDRRDLLVFKANLVWLGKWEVRDSLEHEEKMALQD